MRRSSAQGAELDSSVCNSSFRENRTNSPWHFKGGAAARSVSLDQGSPESSSRLMKVPPSRDLIFFWEPLNWVTESILRQTYRDRQNIWLLRPSWDRHTETTTLQRRLSPLCIWSRHLDGLLTQFIWIHRDWFLTSSILSNAAVEGCSFPMHT